MGVVGCGERQLQQGCLVEANSPAPRERELRVLGAGPGSHSEAGVWAARWTWR